MHLQVQKTENQGRSSKEHVVSYPGEIFSRTAKRQRPFLVRDYGYSTDVLENVNHEISLGTTAWHDY